MIRSLRHVLPVVVLTFLAQAPRWLKVKRSLNLHPSLRKHRQLRWKMSPNGPKNSGTPRKPSGLKKRQSGTIVRRKQKLKVFQVEKVGSFFMSA